MITKSFIGVLLIGLGIIFLIKLLSKQDQSTLLAGNQTIPSPQQKKKSVPVGILLE